MKAATQILDGVRQAVEQAIQLRQASPEGKEIRFLAPCHNDHEPSARWNGDKGTWYCDVCKAGGGYKQLAELLGVSIIPARNGHSTRRIVQTYNYTDENGGLLYQVVRYEPKDFRQRRPDGKGGWIWDLKGVRPVAYQLSNLSGQPRVYKPEGEKDVDRLRSLGLSATCNSGGAGKWSDAHTQQLKVAGVSEVIILPDNDEPGRQHAESVARSCFAAGLVAKIVALPNLPPKGDVSDWLDAGGTKDDLNALADAAPCWVLDSPGGIATDETDEDAHNDRPELDCEEGDLDALTTQAWTIVTAQNHPELLYQRGSLAVRLEEDEHGRARLVELTDARLRYEVARLARCTKATRAPSGGHPLGREDCKPPLDMIRNMRATPSSEIPLPIVRGIVEVPVVSKAGVLVRIPGYDPDSQLLYRPYDPTGPIRLPDTPTSEDLAWARNVIDDLLIDFPFASHADRTNSIGVMLLPFVRHRIVGPTPNHLFEGPGPGTGKGLLAAVSFYPAVGTNVGIIADARDDDEMRKRITARLLEGSTVTLFDNVTRPVDSGVICAAITGLQWEDRRLGRTETISVPISTIWAMTANNPTLSAEIARRTVRIRLDPKVDRPWLRDGFRHPDLLLWVQQHRETLVRAILIFVQSWIAAGEPAPTVRPLGSFESWTRVIGGILECGGFTQFLGNALALYEIADTEGATWRTFTELWWAAHHDQPVSVKELFVIAEGLDGLYLGKAANERGQRSSLGRQLKKRRDQVIGSYQMTEAGSSNNAALWRLSLHSPLTQQHDEEVCDDNN